MKDKLLFLPLAFFAFAAVAQPFDDVVVAGGKYYAGDVFGRHDYVAHSNITLTAFRIMRSEVTYRSYTDVHEWALEHGYAFGAGCNGASYEDCLPVATDNGMHPVTNVEWSDAVVFANALSEKSGLKPVYLNKNGDPARDSSTDQFTQDTQANGYRLPTAEEWQVAARGGKAALQQDSYGDAFAGSKNANAVAPHSGRIMERAVIQKVLMMLFRIFSTEVNRFAPCGLGIMSVKSVQATKPLLMNAIRSTITLILHWKLKVLPACI